VPKKQKKADAEVVLDGYERWLRKQPVKEVRARSGFVSSEREGE
jgi:hypothetical protein